MQNEINTFKSLNQLSNLELAGIQFRGSVNGESGLFKNLKHNVNTSGSPVISDFVYDNASPSGMIRRSKGNLLNGLLSNVIVDFKTLLKK